MITKRRVSFWRFKSLPARIIAGAYCILSLAVAAEGIFFPQSDGGEFLLLQDMCWPWSRLVNFIGLALRQSMSAGTYASLGRFPSPTFSVIDTFDALPPVIIGTLWYYGAVKAIDYVLRVDRLAKSSGERGHEPNGT